jgi:hypothetical protein
MSRAKLIPDHEKSCKVSKRSKCRSCVVRYQHRGVVQDLREVIAPPICVLPNVQVDQPLDARVYVAELHWQARSVPHLGTPLPAVARAQRRLQRE